MSLPERLGRLRRVERIGVGGFATVWRYHDDELDSDVAVKALAENWAARSDVRERFLDEARILRRADSDHLVRVHDIGETDAGTPYFVMTYADRGTLAQRLDSGRPPSVPEALDLVRQAALGLRVLHRQGIIHRDVKPANLLLHSAGPDGDQGTRLMVADLGMAKAVLHASGLTQVVGTPAYMAPEQATGVGLSPRADVYALAAVAYELLTGRVVREGGLADLLDPEPPPAPSTLAELPASVDPVLMRALAPDPEARWPAVDSFSEALAAALSGAAPAGGTVPAAATRARTSPAAVVALFLLVLAGTFTAAYAITSTFL